MRTKDNFTRLGYVTHLVDPTTLSIVNITLPNQHGLDPGWVLRQDKVNPDGIYIHTYGAGTGANSLEVNSIMARPILGGNLFFNVTPKAQFPNLKKMKNKTKAIKKIFIFLCKLFTLAICGVTSLRLLTPLFPMESMHPFHYGQWFYIYYSPIKYSIAFIFHIIFGVPYLLIIDKFFSRFTSIYIIGGAFSSMIAWTMLDGGTGHAPFIWNSPWPINWNLGIFFMACGLTTGIIFTLTLLVFDKIKQKLRKS